MDVREYLGAVRAHWLLAVSLLLLGLAGAAVLSWLTPPAYAASTQLFVSTPNTADVSTAYQGNLFSQQRVSSYAELLRGEEISSRVVENLGIDMTAEELSDRISVAVIPDTVILQATVTDSSPERAQEFATALGVQFPTLVEELERPPGQPAAPVKLTVVQTAKLPTTPVEPNIIRNIAGGLILGLLAGLGAAILRDRLDNTIKAAEVAYEISGATALGAVLFNNDLAKRPAGRAGSVHQGVAESYRQIRTNLQFVDVDNPPRVLVITSSVSGEGKTTTAINLALVLSQSGQRVCLVEGDLRRPQLAAYLPIVGGAGLTNILAGSAGIGDVVQPMGDGKLSVLAAGAHPPNPSELLSSALMRSVIQELRDLYDFVIVDSPPLLPVTDGAVLARAADGAVIIARHGVTQCSQLALAVDSLRKIDANILGTVMNMVPAKESEGYGYGYGYGPSPQRHNRVRDGHRGKASTPGRSDTTAVLGGRAFLSRRRS